MRGKTTSDMQVLLSRSNPLGRNASQLSIMMIDHNGVSRYNIDGELPASGAGAIVDGQAHSIAASDSKAMARVSDGRSRSVAEIPQPGRRISSRCIRKLNPLPDLGLDRVETKRVWDRGNN